MDELEARVARTLAAIDLANAADPTLGPDGTPEAVAYGRRMSEMLARLRPDAGAALRIAVRAQHIERWKVPRAAYPEGRAGYLRWRTDLGRAHAERTAEILRAEGWDEETVARVRSIVRKQQLGRDEDAQALEDCACLVFLATGFAAFAAKHDDDKVVDILRKTWTKMSEAAHHAALASVDTLGARERALIARALAPRP